MDVVKVCIYIFFWCLLFMYSNCFRLFICGLWVLDWLLCSPVSKCSNPKPATMHHPGQGLHTNAEWGEHHLKWIYIPRNYKVRPCCCCFCCLSVCLFVYFVYRVLTFTVCCGVTVFSCDEVSWSCIPGKPHHPCCGHQVMVLSTTCAEGNRPAPSPTVSKWD